MGLLGPHLREKCFSGGFSSTGCWTLSQAAILCNIKENQWCKFEKMDGENRQHYEPNLRKWQKNYFRARFWAPNFFSWIFLLLDVRHCCKLLSYAIWRKMFDPNSRKCRKPYFGSDLGCQFSFSKISLRQSLNIMVNYYHVQYQKTLMTQFWENLVTDGQLCR